MSLGARTRDSSDWHRRVCDSIDLLGPIFVGTSTNSSNDYTVTPKINEQTAIGALVDGERFCWIPNATNTGAATLAISPLVAAVSIKKQDGATALIAGEIESGVPHIVQYSTALGVFRLTHPTRTTLAPSGWSEVSETWTYASGDDVTVASDATTRYAIGQKVRYKQGGGYKYGYINSVSATNLGVFAGLDYIIANAAITDVAISSAVSAVGFPELFNFFFNAPAGFSAPPTNTVNTFRLDGVICEVLVRQGTAGTSNATNFTQSAPITAKTVSNGVWGGSVFEAIDNGAVLSSPGAYIASGGSVFTLLRDKSGTAWTNSGSKAASYSIRYPIA